MKPLARFALLVGAVSIAGVGLQSVTAVVLAAPAAACAWVKEIVTSSLGLVAFLAVVSGCSGTGTAELSDQTETGRAEIALVGVTGDPRYGRPVHENPDVQVGSQSSGPLQEAAPESTPSEQSVSVRDDTAGQRTPESLDEETGGNLYFLLGAAAVLLFGCLTAAFLVVRRRRKHRGPTARKSTAGEEFDGLILRRPRAPKKIAYLSVGLGILVILGAGFALRHKVWELYYLSQLGSDNQGARRRSAEELGEMRSTRAIPALIRALADPEKTMQDTAATALTRIGIPAVRALGQVLENGPRELRLRAIDTLRSMKSMAQFAIPPLILALDDDDPRVRAGSAQILGDVGQEAETPVSPLIRRLRDQDEGVILAAVGALNKLGHPSETIPVLLTMLASPNQAVRNAVLVTLQEQGRTAVPGLTMMFQSGGPKLRIRILSVFIRLGPEAEEAIPVLTKACEDDNVLVRASAAKALRSVRNEPGHF